MFFCQDVFQSCMLQNCLVLERVKTFYKAYNDYSVGALQTYVIQKKLLIGSAFLPQSLVYLYCRKTKFVKSW